MAVRAAACLLLALGHGCGKDEVPTKPLPPPVLTSPHIAFENNSRIKLLDPTTGQVVQLSPGDAPETDPVISPDGSRIAFARRERVGPYWHLVTMAVDGRYRQLCTNDSMWFDTGPHWSPDGKRLVFTRTRLGSDVYTIGADGDSIRQITTDGKSQALDWSPDGRRLLLVTNSMKLVSVAVDGSDARALSESTGTFFASGDYSPNGNVIVLADDPLGESGPRLEVMDADGANRRALADSTQFVLIRRCSWSPDGLAIVFAASRNWYEERLMILRLDGTRSEPIFSDPTYYESPDWGPKP